jgi:hypothetical protein
MRKAAVYYKEWLAGTLTETDEGEYTFQYDEKYIGEHSNESITLTMPVNSITYKEKRLCVITGITKEIKGFYFGDKELTSSKEDIKKLYETCPMFIQEVDNFFSDVNNFFLNK